MHILVTTYPFGASDPAPLRALEREQNVTFTLNPFDRKLTEDELCALIPETDVMIAGTEPITRKALERAKNLRCISRVGIGLDSVDLQYCRERNITVSYTPDAPAPAVAELTLGHILGLLRDISVVNSLAKSGIWQRRTGERLANRVIGIIGTGRVGSKVLRHLQGFSPKKILVNDLHPQEDFYRSMNAEYVEKERIWREADVISLHVPLTPQTRNMISAKELAMMQPQTILINTARGGIIHEHDLFDALTSRTIAAAAVDVFEKEPYFGELITSDYCIISPHIGSMTHDCRFDMEMQATEEALRFVRGEQLLNVIPEYEYELQQYNSR